jgi:hypothetical protein
VRRETTTRVGLLSAGDRVRVGTWERVVTSIEQAPAGFPPDHLAIHTRQDPTDTDEREAWRALPRSARVVVIVCDD